MIYWNYSFETLLQVENDLKQFLVQIEISWEETHSVSDGPGIRESP